MKLKTVLFSCWIIFASFDQMTLAYTNQDVATLLDWISDPNANLCRGYYYEPESLRQQLPGPITRSATHVSYEGAGTLRNYGESTVSKNVVITQPGRIAKADQANIYRDPDSGKITTIQLKGHVKVREPGRLVAGPYTAIRLDEHTVETGPVAYHLFEDPQRLKIPMITRAYDAWGTADKTVRDSNGLVRLWNATYTTCTPTDPAWQIAAGRIVLDQKAGFGTAYDSVLRFYQIPVLYVPIYSFPIDNRRKTGFLTPDLSYEENNGLQISFPYYWNLAPNYDLLTTPRWIQMRGLQINSLFRYLLTPKDNGEVYLSFVPYDNRFRQFRDDTLDNPPVAPPDTSLAPYLDQLQSDNDTRAFFRLQHNIQFNDKWKGHIQTNYATDPYYFEDFGTAYSDIIANQLLNQADVEYQDETWQFTGVVQSYQTLHSINQAANPAVNQYTRLPELDFSADYSDFWQGMDFALGGQSVNFLYQSQFSPTTLQQPVGERLHLRPMFSRPFMGTAGYFIPQVGVDSTSYATELGVETGMGDRPVFNASRNVPIVDVDSGLYFDRYLHLHNRTYLNTLEPRLFYLYVPFFDQAKYPNFDSTLLPFTFGQLFDVNRFTSYDRLENANQFSFGLTSRIIDDTTLMQTFKIDFGFGYYLQSPKVCLNADDCFDTTFRYVSPKGHLTPLVGQLTYYPWINWSTAVSYAYDSSVGKTNNAQVGINYNYKQTYVFSTNYQFVREQNGDPDDKFGLSNDTNLISSGIAWPLSQHWSGLAYASYNISKERPDSYYGGLQYDTCCWTFRVIASRSFKVQDTNSAGELENVYKNSYFVQLQLKSLGSFGTSPGSLLSNTLSGYLDPLK